MPPSVVGSQETDCSDQMPPQEGTRVVARTTRLSLRVAHCGYNNKGLLGNFAKKALFSALGPA
jgi:hypothetical protein